MNETLQRMAAVETNVENIKEDVKEIKEMLNSHIQREQQATAEMEKKYASKWVEKVAIGLIMIAIGALFSFIKFGV